MICAGDTWLPSAITAFESVPLRSDVGLLSDFPEGEDMRLAGVRSMI